MDLLQRKWSSGKRKHESKNGRKKEEEKTVKNPLRYRTTYNAPSRVKTSKITSKSGVHFEIRTRITEDSGLILHSPVPRWICLKEKEGKRWSGDVTCIAFCRVLTAIYISVFVKCEIKRKLSKKKN